MYTCKCIYTHTVIPWDSLASELIKPYTHCILMRKICFTALGTCSELVTLAGTCES